MMAGIDATRTMVVDVALAEPGESQDVVEWELFSHSRLASRASDTLRIVGGLTSLSWTLDHKTNCGLGSLER